jgi:hypothetical protein
MSSLLLILAGYGLLAAAEPAKPTTLRYLRPAGDKFVLESEITTTRSQDGVATYVSLTDRGAEKMTLTLRFNKDDQITEAEAAQETAQGKKVVTAKLDGARANLVQDGAVHEITKVPANAIVTTAPDWSDIFLLVHRYDGKKGGKQEFPGLWIHPTKQALVLTFTIERLGNDTVKVKNEDVKLDRYKVRLRSGDYLVWADVSGRVCKLLPPGAKASAVVLEGYEEATRELK